MHFKKLPACFFRTTKDNEPVREWLKCLDEPDRYLIGMDIATVEYGWPLGMPLVKPLGRGLFEIRSNITSNRIARVLFCVVEQEMVLLHGFIKKSEKIPHADMELAVQRAKEARS